MKRFLRTTLLTGLPFGLFMGLLMWSTDGRTAAIFGATIGLFGFGPAMAALEKSSRESMQGKWPLTEGESILHEGPAKLTGGLTGRTGWLYLTNRQLHFTTNQMSMSNYKMSLPLSDIQSTNTTSTSLVMPNGLLVTTAQGDHRFAVEGRQRWADAVSSAQRANK